jgi:hypothetical protein
MPFIKAIGMALLVIRLFCRRRYCDVGPALALWPQRESRAELAFRPGPAPQLTTADSNKP